MSSKYCEDCGDECRRRTRCLNCGMLVCRHCYHHWHGEVLKRGDLRERAQSVPGVREPLGPADPVAGESAATGLSGVPVALPGEAPGGDAADLPGRGE
jgi:hypothetical protein